MASVPSRPPAPASPAPAQVAAAFAEAEASARSSPDPSRCLGQALRILHDGLAGAFVAAFVLEHGRLWLVASDGLTIVPNGIEPGSGVVGRALELGDARFVPDVAADPDYLAVAPGIRSELALPVRDRGELVGLLNVETTFALSEDVIESSVGLGEALGPVLGALRHARRLDVAGLARLFVSLGSLRDTEAVATLVAASLPRVLPLETAQVALWTGRGELELVAAWRAGPEAPALFDAEGVIGLRSHLGGGVLLGRLTAETSPDLAGRGLRSAVLLPLRANGRELGVLVGASRFGTPLDREHADLAALLGAHAAVTLDTAQTLRQERVAALTDPLTGLSNRRGFEEAIGGLLHDAERTREPVTLVVLDCDDFKDLNDRAGHEFGDAVLAELGQVLLDLAADAACAARIGGDEFAVLLPGRQPDGDAAAAGDLVGQLSDRLHRAGFPVRMSGGIASYPFDAATPAQLLRAADQALYDAKANGKNHLMAFGDLLRPDARPTLAARGSRRGDRAGAPALADAAEAALRIWLGTTAEEVLERLCSSLAYVVGATAALASRVDGPLLADVVQHAVRGADLGPASTYVIAEFPVTERVLATGKACAISFLDDDLDPAEAFVLRELRMNSCLLLPLVVRERSWGLVELYERRLRRYEPDDQSIAECLTAMAARRLETLGKLETRRRRLRAFRLPSRG